MRLGESPSQLRPDLGVQPAAQSQALPRIPRSDQELLMGAACFGEAPDTSSHRTEPTRRFAKHSANSHLTSCLSRFFSSMDFKKSYFSVEGNFHTAYLTPERCPSGGRQAHCSFEDQTQQGQDVASWAAGLLGDDALMIQLALILQQQQHFPADPAI